MVGGALLEVLGLAGCIRGPLYRYRYKLTLNVLADGVVHTGVNVVQMARQSVPRKYQWPTSMSGADVKGQANVVELGRGRVLFALLSKLDPWADGVPAKHWSDVGPDPVLFRIYGLKSKGFDDNAVEPALEALMACRGAHEIGPDDLPTLVTFRDLADPKTVERVDPYDLGKTLGYGVTLQSATLEITTDPLTGGIEEHLPWLHETRGYLDGQSIHRVQNATLANTLDVGDFIRKAA